MQCTVCIINYILRGYMLRFHVWMLSFVSKEYLTLTLLNQFLDGNHVDGYCSYR